MRHWLAGIMAAIVAWFVNRFLVVKGGDRAVIWLVPPLEEILKTGLAVLWGASMPLAHGAFGLLEAVHDYLSSPRWGLWAGLCSIITHFLLGWVTLLSYRFYPSWILAILVSSFLHIIWNAVVISLLDRIFRHGRR